MINQKCPALKKCFSDIKAAKEEATRLNEFAPTDIEGMCWQIGICLNCSSPKGRAYNVIVSLSPAKVKVSKEGNRV